MVPLDSSQDLTKNHVQNITYHASHITHHILDMNLQVLQNIIDKNSGYLQEFITTDLKEACQTSQTKHFTVKQINFWIVRFSFKIQY